MKLLYIFVIFCVCQIVSGSNDKKIYLNSDNRSFIEENVDDVTVFCRKPSSKTIQKMWMTAFFEINSSEPCTVYDNVKDEELNNLKSRPTGILSNIESGFKRFRFWLSDSTSEKECYDMVNVPLFKEHCIAVETKGRLQVDLRYQYLDFRLLAIFLLGFLLLFCAGKLSKNELFHYFSGISLGIIGSILIAMFIAHKFIPQKKWIGVALLSSSSILFFTLKLIVSNFNSLSDQTQLYFLYYVIAMGFISWLYCYYRGPITNERVINIIELLLKMLGCALIYLGTSCRELSVTVLLMIFVAKLMVIFMNSSLWPRIYFKLFPKKRCLMSIDEYNKEAQEYTAKALLELREFCQSPKCNTWSMVSKLKSPERFAQFVQTGQNHVNEDEILEYENYSISNDLIDDDDDEITYNNDTSIQSN